MFENLTDRLQRTFKNLRGQGKLTEEHLDVALAEIREALLEGDVNVGVADELLANIRKKALGTEVMLQLSPDQQVVKIVRDELLESAGQACQAAVCLAAAFGLDDCRLARLRQNHHHRQIGEMAFAARAPADRGFHGRVSPRRAGTVAPSGQGDRHVALARARARTSRSKLCAARSRKQSFRPAT